MMELYTRFPLAKVCIGGYMEIPKGAICILNDVNRIIYNDKVVCVGNSQTASDYFCPNDPESILKADLLDEFLFLDPPDMEDDYWKQYGEFNHQLQHWQWNEEILDYTSDQIKALILKIKNEGG